MSAIERSFKSILLCGLLLVFFSCEKKKEDLSWKLLTQPLSTWTHTHTSENKRDSARSDWDKTHWETFITIEGDSVPNSLFFFAPDTLDFELLLNGRMIMMTNGQGAIWPGVIHDDEIPIYSWSKSCRPFKIDRDLWQKNLKKGSNKLLLKIKTAPVDLSFATQCGIYIPATPREKDVLTFHHDHYDGGQLPAVFIQVHETLLKQKEKTAATFSLKCQQSHGDCEPIEREIDIGIRGFSSALFPKKQYSIKISGDTLKKEKVSFLGMHASSKWILQGPYSDPSLIRNPLAYELWRQMGYHAPQSRYVELVMNGVYQGIYLLMERNEIGPARLDLNTREPGSDAFLIQLNRPDQTDDMVVAGGMQFIVDDPPGIVVDSLYLKKIKMTMEEFISTTQDPELKGGNVNWNSWADFFIMQELSKNSDAYLVSTFLHRGNSSNQSPLNAGPVWDFDIAFGGSQIMNCDKPDGFVAEFSGQAAALFKHLFQHPKFRALMNERYSMWRNTVLSDANLNHTIDSISSLLDPEALNRNFHRFPVFGLNKFLTHPAPVKDYATELTNLKQWLQMRTQWLDTHLTVNGN